MTLWSYHCRRYEHTFVWRSPASSTVAWRLRRARVVPGGLGPGAPTFPIRSRRRSGPRRWCGRWRRSAPRSSRSEPGEAFFAVDGLRGLYGGSTSRGPGGGAAGGRARRGRSPAGRTRFAAFLAAAATGREPVPVAALRPRLRGSAREAEELVEALERSGSRPWGRSPGSPPTRSPTASARSGCERCGSAAARRSRCGRAPRTRSWPRRSSCRKGPPGASSTAPSSCSSTACWRRRSGGAGPCSACASGRCSPAAAAGASSRGSAGRAPRPGAARVLAPRLEELPGPATALRLRALGLGPPAGDQLELAVGGAEPRRRRLGAAVREVRAAQGAEALLKVLPVDSASRVPERWAMLTPFPEL